MRQKSSQKLRLRNYRAGNETIIVIGLAESGLARLGPHIAPSVMGTPTAGIL